MAHVPKWKKRKCRKCGASWLWWIKIGGKLRNTQNRRFCLKCSPFGCRNTKPDDPARPNKPRDWARRDQHMKTAYQARMLIRAAERKHRLVARFGGGCSCCGYCRSTRALAFYRCGKAICRLSADGLWAMTWQKAVSEARKCRLLCLNCLAELLERKAFRRRKVGVMASISPP